MARTFHSNPLKLKPRDMRSREQESGTLSGVREDFEPRLRFYLEDVRQAWPGQAPVSWKEAIQQRQWPSAFPGSHLAAVECLLEIARNSRGGSFETTLAWQTIALSVVHVIVDGGGLPPGVSNPSQGSLLRRADACLPPFGKEHRAGLVGIDEVAYVLGDYGNRAEVRGDPLRAGFVLALKDALEFRERVHTPGAADVVSALHFVCCHHPTLFQSALGIPSAQLMSARSSEVMKERPAKTLNADPLLQSLLQVAENMGLSDQQASPPRSSARTPRGIERPSDKPTTLKPTTLEPTAIAEGRSPLRARSSTRQLKRRYASDGPRPTSDAKIESTWDQRRPFREGWDLRLPKKLTVLGSLALATCLISVVVATIGQWSDNGREVGEVSQAKETGLPNPLDTVDAFVYAKTIPEKLALLSNPEDVPAARAYFESLGAEESKVEKVRSLGHGRSGVLSFHVSSVTFSNDQVRMIYVLTDPVTGALSVDWHGYARTVAVPWRDLLQGVVDESDVRVFVERGNYYNYAFEDVDRYQCYKLSSDDIEDVLYGYVDLQSPRKALIEELIGLQRTQRMALRLRRPMETAEPTQFLIEGVLANDWVIHPSSSLESFMKDFSLEGSENGPVWAPTR